MPDPQRRIDGVTFDHWQTMVWEPGRTTLRDERVRSWMALLDEAGIGPGVVDEVAVKVAVSAAWKALIASHAEGVVLTAADAARASVAALRLPAGAQRSLVEPMVEAFCTAMRRVDLVVAPGLADALDVLRAAGIRIGIICDVAIDPAPELRRHLERHDLLRRFDHWSFSDEVGAVKPSPAIFAHAASGLGVVDPRRLAHVGDSVRADVGGAKAAGWQAVRYVGSTDPALAGHDVSDREAGGPARVVDGHAELAAWALGALD